MNRLIEKINNFNFDFQEIKLSVLKILMENNFPLQIGLTHTINAVTEEEKLYESVGSLYDSKTGLFKLKENEFTIFNEKYKNTILYEIYKSIPDLGRFRIMTMSGPSCYSVHRDLTKRYHYVLETNKNCYFLFPELKEFVHVPLDKNLYLVNTLQYHTFLNGSKERRIHLVFDDLSTLKN